MKRTITRLLPPALLDLWRSRRPVSHVERGRREREKVLADLLVMPALTQTSVEVDGRLFQLCDARSFPKMYADYFMRGIFRFDCDSKHPFFLDCGANVGVVARYLKEKFPAARVVAFEPDDACYAALQANVGGLPGVECVKAAVWKSDGTVTFNAVGGEGGHLGEVAGKPVPASTTVRSVRLRDYLGERVDFLKMDIEGAELEVLRDCRDLLGNVERIFVEYHSFASSPQYLCEFIGILEGAGFRLHIQAGDGVLRPFDGLPVFNLKDLRLNIYAIRHPRFFQADPSGNPLG